MSTTARIALLAAAVLLAAGAAFAEPGERPQNLAVSADGSTILITSLSSSSITQIHNGGAPTHIDVEGTTWGVAFLDDNTAVVTHHGIDRLTILTRDDATQPFAATSDHQYTFARSLQYSTDVAVHPYSGGQTFYVANRGRGYTDGGEDSWRHAVLEFSYVGGAPTLLRIIPVDREPRALAVAAAGPSDPGVLYVSHIQGDLGLQMPADSHRPVPYDGGTVLAIRLGSLSETRYRIGSPVREAAVRPNADGSYRLFLTHVGEGALSEDPANGGKAIPNVITSIGFSAGHGYVDREDILLGHFNEADESDNIAVVPERVAFSTYSDLSGTYHYAWVTNSASGTVTRLRLSADGRLRPGAIPFSMIDNVPDVANKVIIDRTAQGQLLLADATPTLVSDDFLLPIPGDFAILPVDADAITPARSSVPRGVVADAANGRILLVTELDMDLVEMNANLPANKFPRNVVRTSLASTPVGEAERAFFTAGGGFVFREVADPPAAQVDNLSCTTCHPGGHHDGKVHVSAAVSQTVPVVTPSVFDISNTEWLFFDGLRTVVDNDDGCTYCQQSKFFDTTKPFTDALVSPGSPYTAAATVEAPAALGPEAGLGRGWFDAMECSRCHQGDVDSFTRSSIMNGTLDPVDGPLSTVDATASRMLNDRTQVFVSETGNQTTGNLSARNRTDVGTRAWDVGQDRAVNTPALAGAWDNRPYMHDGRHATLASVLQSTWLNDDALLGDEFQVAAPRWDVRDLGAVPDNWKDSQNVAAGEPLTIKPGTPVAFGTHGVDEDGSGLSAATYLQDNGGYESMVAFLNELSSHTDPCSGAEDLAIGAPQAAYDHASATTTLQWDVNVPVACDVTAMWGGAESALQSLPAASHTKVIDHAQHPALEIRIDARLDLCGLVADPVVIDLDNVTSWRAVTTMACDRTTMTWLTDISTSCLVEWGPHNRDGVYAYSIASKLGQNHAVTVNVEPGVRYMARVTPRMPGAQSYEFYWRTYPCATDDPADRFLRKSGDLASVPTGLHSVFPNPFNPMTTLSFGMQQAGPVVIKVYDLNGRLVRTLAQRDYPAGSHEITWNGTDDEGRTVASGAYLVRFQSRDKEDVQRVALLK